MASIRDRAKVVYDAVRTFLWFPALNESYQRPFVTPNTALSDTKTVGTGKEALLIAVSAWFNDATPTVGQPLYFRIFDAEGGGQLVWVEAVSDPAGAVASVSLDFRFKEIRSETGFLFDWSLSPFAAYGTNPAGDYGAFNVMWNEQA